MFAAVVCLIDSRTPHPIGIEVAPYEVAGAALSLLLVLRTNAGYDRWWEGRKLWGGVVNQCRNLAGGALAYGPRDQAWRGQVIRWIAAFPHVLRRACGANGRWPAPTQHGPNSTRSRPSSARKRPGELPRPITCPVMSSPNWHDCSRRRSIPAGSTATRSSKWTGNAALLIDHCGGCERIQDTPLPQAYSTQIRRFLLLFLAALPFALIFRIDWRLTPLVTLLIAYPILALDEIGSELQQPFSRHSLNHLPLDAICERLEKNLLDMLRQAEDATSDAHPT